MTYNTNFFKYWWTVEGNLVCLHDYNAFGPDIVNYTLESIRTTYDNVVSHRFWFLTEEAWDRECSKIQQGYIKLLFTLPLDQYNIEHGLYMYINSKREFLRDIYRIGSIAPTLTKMKFGWSNNWTI